MEQMMARRENITHQKLLEILYYDAKNGAFIWKITKARAMVGAIAGSINAAHGYVEIGIDGVLYRAHRLAFFYVNGTWPVGEIDHIDLNRANNSWSNLREASHSENARNKSVRSDSKSGLKGAFLREYGKYSSKIKVGNSTICLGTFKTAEEAHAAYCAAAEKYHGTFARAL